MAILGSHIPFDLTSVPFKGIGSHVPFDLGAEKPPECVELWSPKEFNRIDFGFNVKRTEVEFNKVDFNFECFKPETDCPDLWKPEPGGAMHYSFGRPNEFQNSLMLYENWKCDGGEKPPVIFDGYITMSDGEHVSARLEDAIQLRLFDGESVTVDLKDHPASLLSARAYEGETLGKVELDVPDRYDAFDGESVTVDLKDHPAALLQPRAYDGETLEKVELYVPDRYVAFDGEEMVFDITPTPAPEFSFRLTDGEEATVTTVRTDPRDWTMVFHDGESARVSALDDAGVYKAFEGEAVTTRLAVDERDWDFRGYEGESVKVDLMDRPREDFGFGIFRDGEEVTLKVSSSRSIDLNPYPMCGDDTDFDVNAGNRRFFELGVSCCVPCNVVPGAEVNIKLDYNTDVNLNENQIGDCDHMTVDLQARPRFKFNMFDGETLVGRDPNYLGLIAFREGEVADGHTISLTDYNLDLCRGNLIPDADYVYIELSTGYGAECYADMLYDGESAHVEISSTVRAPNNQFDGESMWFDIFIDPIIRVGFLDGEVARVSNPEFSPKFQDGETNTFTLYEGNYEASDGEVMTASIETRYYVEFLENGCLDNEFMPMDENGDADHERFRPVPVELDFFAHAIKARCF